MKTITVDILSYEGMQRLHDLENQQLIRLHTRDLKNRKPVSWKDVYKGAMTQQSVTEVDKQLNDLRNEWE